MDGNAGGDEFQLPRLLEIVSDHSPDRMNLVRVDEVTAVGHRYRAVCGYDARLSIEWGAPTPRAALATGSQSTPWSQRYPDHDVVQQRLDVLLDGATVHSIDIALVDGARCWIPWPEDLPGGWGFRVSTWAATVVQTANELVHATTDTLDYLGRADISIWPGEAPEPR